MLIYKQPIQWLNPLAPSPSHESGMSFEENGFLDEGLSWPPPDPDKMPAQRHLNGDAWEGSRSGFTYTDDPAAGDDEYLEAFRARQAQDLRRRRPIIRGPAVDCGGLPGAEDEDVVVQGEEWRNEEGESLGDYGVEDEDVPLSELMRRRRNEVDEGYNE